jgi:hypothetical protein
VPYEQMIRSSWGQRSLVKHWKPSSERQFLDLAKLFLSADQINLYFIQIIVTIRQFFIIYKHLFFLVFLINVSTKL